MLSAGYYRLWQNSKTESGAAEATEDDNAGFLTINTALAIRTRNNAQFTIDPSVSFSDGYSIGLLVGFVF